MINATEQAEREYLEEIKEKLTLAIKRVDDTVRQFSDELREKKQYIHEHQSGMDEADMVAAGQSINRMAFTGRQPLPENASSSSLANPLTSAALISSHRIRSKRRCTSACIPSRTSGSART